MYVAWPKTEWKKKAENRGKYPKMPQRQGLPSEFSRLISCEAVKGSWKFIFESAACSLPVDFSRCCCFACLAVNSLFFFFFDPRPFDYAHMQPQKKKNVEKVTGIFWQESPLICPLWQQFGGGRRRSSGRARLHLLRSDKLLSRKREIEGHF